MTGVQTSGREIALSDVESELATTRRFLERLPDDKLEWTPHERSSTLGRLAMHIIELVKLQAFILTVDGGLDLAAGGPAKRKFVSSRVDALASFDRSVTRLRAAIAAATDESFAAPWTLRAGERIFGSGTRGSVLRRNGISHLVHHRAQLGVYYRLLDIPVPDTYGPTADDR
jgi:uncharacterized damage-inducible protein DinB